MGLYVKTTRLGTGRKVGSPSKGYVPVIPLQVQEFPTPAVRFRVAFLPILHVV